MVDCLNVDLRKFIYELVGPGKEITFKDFLRVDRPQTGCRIKEGSNCDRFRLAIPYAGTTLRWEVLFNSDEPHLPPDFIFGNSDRDFEPNLEEIKALYNWNPTDSESLAAVVREILQQYKTHQINIIKSSSKRITQEYEALNDLCLVPDSEIFVQRNAQLSFQQVHIIVKLPVDLTSLPPYLINNNLGDDYVCLHILYEGLDATSVSIRVYLSPRVEHALSEVSLLYPNWLDGDECLFSYLPLVQQYFAERIDEISSAYERRREYVAAFLALFGSSVIEYDAEKFSKMALLLETRGFFCLLKIEITSLFPEEQPLFILQSIYHLHNKQLVEGHDSVYPYSPRWSATEMASRARMMSKQMFIHEVKGRRTNLHRLL